MGRQLQKPLLQKKEYSEHVQCVLSAILSPVLDATLIILDSKKNGAYDEGKKNVDAQLHRQKTFRQQRQPSRQVLLRNPAYISMQHLEIT